MKWTLWKDKKTANEPGHLICHHCNVFCLICRLLTDTYPKCKEIQYECFVLDGAGFLIMHKDFLSPGITKKDLEYVHISAKERDIANDLIGKGYLKRKRCRNLEKINVENFYELDIKFDEVNTLATGSTCKQYQISRMTTTNAFIGVYILVFFSLSKCSSFLWLLLSDFGLSKSPFVVWG